MKKSKRILGTLLAILLIASIMSVAVFAAPSKTYLALGDSISTGYGLSNAAEEAFPVLVAGSEYTLDNDAVDGYTTTDLLAYLQDDNNKQAVQNADVITVTIGGNDLLQAFYDFLATKIGTFEGDTLTAAKVAALLAANDITFVSSAAAIINSEDFTVSAEVTGTIIANLNAIAAAIDELNGDATVVFVTQYNPYTYLAGEAQKTLTEGQNMLPVFANLFNAIIALESNMDTAVLALNALTESVASQYGFIVADVYDGFDEAVANNTVLCNASLNGLSVNLDIHPNTKGHTLIADAVKKVLPENHIHRYTYSASKNVITESCNCGHNETATIYWLDGAEIIYDGKKHSATVDYSEGWAGDRPRIVYIEKNREDDGCITAGTYVARLSVSGASARSEFVIKKAVLSITANPHTINYGEAPAHNGVNYQGFVNGENESVLGGTLEFDIDYTQYGDVGIYTITPKGLTSDNYVIIYQAYNLTVVPAENLTDFPCNCVDRCTNVDIEVTCDICASKGDSSMCMGTPTLTENGGVIRLSDTQAEIGFMAYANSNVVWRYYYILTDDAASQPTAEEIILNGKNGVYSDPYILELNDLTAGKKYIHIVVNQKGMNKTTNVLRLTVPEFVKLTIKPSAEGGSYDEATNTLTILGGGRVNFTLNVSGYVHCDSDSTIEVTPANGVVEDATEWTVTLPATAGTYTFYYGMNGQTAECTVIVEIHTHSYATEWSKDAGGHWYECSCGDKNGFAEHESGGAASYDAPEVCTVCGYEIAPKLIYEETVLINGGSINVDYIEKTAVIINRGDIVNNGTIKTVDMTPIADSANLVIAPGYIDASSDFKLITGQGLGVIYSAEAAKDLLTSIGYLPDVVGFAPTLRFETRYEQVMGNEATLARFSVNAYSVAENGEKTYISVSRKMQYEIPVDMSNVPENTTLALYRENEDGTRTRQQILSIANGVVLAQTDGNSDYVLVYELNEVNEPEDPAGLPTGAVIAIAVACAAVLAGGGFAIWFKKKKAR